AVRAAECIEECIEECASTADAIKGQAEALDRDGWDRIPRYAKSVVLVGRFLGKGTFSDVFEVLVTAKEEDLKWRRYHQRFSAASEGDEDDESKDELDTEIEAKFGTYATKRDSNKNLEGLSRNAKVDTVELSRPRATSIGSSAYGLSKSLSSHVTLTRPTATSIGSLTTNLGKSLSSHDLGLSRGQDRKMRLAMNSMDAREGASPAPPVSATGTYFILLDQLKETLEDKIVRWKKTAGGRGSSPGLNQVEAAHSVANTLSYLHTKDIVFCDLKPANVGYNSRGVLKLFDFGFAINLGETLRDEVDEEDERDPRLIYEKRGTPRYMAPEVALECGYDTSADVYWFGILL
ncbi:hypothetical protein ACHAWF_012939, partial [Thalassiosira exigua]